MTNGHYPKINDLITTLFFFYFAIHRWSSPFNRWCSCSTTPLSKAGVLLSKACAALDNGRHKGPSRTYIVQHLPSPLTQSTQKHQACEALCTAPTLSLSLASHIQRPKNAAKTSNVQAMEALLTPAIHPATTSSNSSSHGARGVPLWDISLLSTQSTESTLQEKPAVRLWDIPLPSSSIA